MELNKKGQSLLLNCLMEMGDLMLDATMVAWLAICAANDPDRIPVNPAAAQKQRGPMF